jgi:hypothetical protein
VGKCAYCRRLIFGGQQVGGHRYCSSQCSRQDRELRTRYDRADLYRLGWLDECTDGGRVRLSLGDGTVVEGQLNTVSPTHVSVLVGPEQRLAQVAVECVGAIDVAEQRPFVRLLIGLIAIAAFGPAIMIARHWSARSAFVVGLFGTAMAAYAVLAMVLRLLGFNRWGRWTRLRR